MKKSVFSNFLDREKSHSERVSIVERVEAYFSGEDQGD